MLLLLFVGSIFQYLCDRLFRANRLRLLIWAENKNFASAGRAIWQMFGHVPASRLHLRGTLFPRSAFQTPPARHSSHSNPQFSIPQKCSICISPLAKGCYRNCFQHIILERCGCGDPREFVYSPLHHICCIPMQSVPSPFFSFPSLIVSLFAFLGFPLPNESEDRPCDARNPKERACLANQTAVLGGFHHLTHDCHCVQPCTGMREMWKWL